MFILGAFAALAPEEALPSFFSKEISESLNISEQSATAAIVHAIETGRVNARSGIGAYLAFAGGALSAAGAIIGILLARSFRRVPEDIYRDLPEEITRELEGLYQVPDLSVFEARLEAADSLFRAAINSIAEGSTSSGEKTER